MASKPQVTLLGRLGAPARHGISELLKTLDGRCFDKRLILGTLTGSLEIAQAAATGHVQVDSVREAYGIGLLQDVCYVAGYDDVGLMYGCFQLQEMLISGEPVVSMSEAPYLQTRGIYELPHNRDLESERFYSKEYWTTYFDMLARNRINQYHYCFSHQTGYMAPVFAYFLHDGKYPQAKPIDVPEGTVEKNYDMMRFITELAAAHGISFILGMWEVYPWRGGEEDWRPRQPNGVPGVTEEILEDYVYRGAKAMLTEFPNIAGIQVRVNEESSIPESKQTAFFENTIFKAVAETGRLMDYRGWRALPETTEKVKQMCPNLRTSMKYWAEFMGAPYQPCKIDLGYSYGDLLKKPMPYRFMWQVWSLGSPRLLLWGDPEYVRRFVESCKLGGAEGFEINPHLAQKGYGNEPGYWRIFQHREDEYFTHEYERYWMFYLLFGRIAYNPNLKSDAWMREMNARLGGAADAVMRAYVASSRVITFLVQYSLSDPNMYVWPEIDLGGVLEFYLETPTSDERVLQTVPEYIKNLVNGIPSGKRTPRQSARQFQEYSDAILSALAGVGEAHGNKELRSSVLDFRTMAYLARYHALKTEAGIRVEAYFQTGDGSGLREAQRLLRDATVTWEQIISLTGDFYYDRMVTGPSDAGSWKAKRRLAHEDELRLMEIVALHERYGAMERGFDFGARVTMEGFENRPFELFKTFSVEKRFIGVDEGARYTDEAGFGFTRGAPRGVAMARPRLTDRTADWKYRRDALYDVRLDVLRGYRSPLTEDCLEGDGAAEFACVLPDGAYFVTLVFADEQARAKAHGPFSAKVNGVEFARDLCTLPLQRVEKTLSIQVADGKLLLALDGAWFVTAMIVRRAEPVVAHCPPRALSEGEPLRATITVPSGRVEAAHVVIGGAAIPMRDLGGGHFEATMPALPASGAEYAIRAQAAGVAVQTGAYALKPACRHAYDARHEPPSGAKAGEPLSLALSAEPVRDIGSVRLWYSRTNQYDAIECVQMQRQGGAFSACIPGDYIIASRDILYYFEIIGPDGFGAIYPDFRARTPYYVVEVHKEENP